MPVVDKQNPNQTIKGLTGSPADRIQNINKIQQSGIKLCMYGRAKTGKTRLISTFPKPVLIMGTEDGTRSIRGVEGVDFVLLNRSDEVKSLVQYANKNGYKTIAMDNCTQYQSLILTEMLGLERVPTQHERGVIKKIDNQEYSKRTKDGLSEMLDFSGNIVFTAHEKDYTKRREDGDSSPEPVNSDLISPAIGSAVSGAVGGWLHAICDYICQTFIRQEMREQEIGEGITSVLPTGKGEYCLRVGPHPVFMTGFRIPIGALMPDVIVNPTYAKIAEVTEGRYKEKK